MVPQVIVLQLANMLKNSRKNFESQQELAEWVGVEQSSISRFLSAVHEDEQKRKPFSPGADLVALVAKRYGLKYDELLSGMVRDGEWITQDMIANRGRALDILSEEYSSDLLSALKAYKDPIADPGWSAAKWVEYLVKVKTAWEAGLLELPGMKRI